MRCFSIVLGIALLSPSIAFIPSAAHAQTQKAGVVTVLEGNVTTRRVAQPEMPLKFKDDVFVQDTVTTGDKSLARMLLGGKAVVTVRERSILTITEVPGRSTLELASGKFALAVAREKLGPGEEIQIRTPNAVAGVRGTVVITEVNRQGAQTGPGAPAPVTTFFVLRGSIVAQAIDPATGTPTGTPLPIGTLQSSSISGGAPPRVVPVAPEQIPQVTSGLQPTRPRINDDTHRQLVKTQAMQTAVTLINALVSPGSHVARMHPEIVAHARTRLPDAPLADKRFQFSQECAQTGAGCLHILELIAFLREAIAVLSGVTESFELANRPARVFTADFTSDQPQSLLSAVNASAIQTGNGVPFIQIAPASAWSWPARSWR